MKVYLCDACGTDTDESKLRRLHTHGPGHYTTTVTSTGITIPALVAPVDYESWDLCPGCYERKTEDMGWYRKYRAARAASEVKS